MNPYQQDQQDAGRAELERQVEDTLRCMTAGGALPARRRVLVGEPKVYAANPAELAALHAEYEQQMNRGRRVLYTSRSGE